MGFQPPETRNNCLFGEMLCACRFKFRSDVAPKITHFSPSHAIPFTQTPSPKSPSRDPFSPSPTDFSFTQASPPEALSRPLLSLSHTAIPFTQAPPPERPQRPHSPLSRAPMSQHISRLNTPQRAFSGASQRFSRAASRIPPIHCAATVPEGCQRRKRAVFEVQFRRRRTGLPGACQEVY